MSPQPRIITSLSAKDVIVEERVDGSMLIIHKNTGLKFNEITSRPQKEKEVKISSNAEAVVSPGKKNTVEPTKIVEKNIVSDNESFRNNNLLSANALGSVQDNTTVFSSMTGRILRKIMSPFVWLLNRIGF